jgi:hypothetical protein
MKVKNWREAICRFRLLKKAADLRSIGFVIANHNLRRFQADGEAID